MTRFREWFTDVNRAIVAQMAVQKVTQKMLAEHLNVHAATMNRKLKDPGLFTVGEFGSVCERLGIDPYKTQGYAESAD
jgi:hypothetical protein